MNYTREDIYDILHSVIPTSIKKIGQRLKVPDTYRVGTISDEMVQLVQRLKKLRNEGAIEWHSYEGYTLKERIPLKVKANKPK